MRIRKILSAAAATVATLTTSALVAPPAHAELDPICTGTRDEPATYFCVVHVHIEEAFPVFRVEELVEIPEVCVLNACPGPTPIEVPLFDLSDEEFIVLWNNNTCYVIHADGAIDTHGPAPLQDGVPHCD